MPVKHPELSKYASTIGANIRKRRRQRGLSQADLAERIGICSQAMSKIESGEVAANIVVLHVAAIELDCTVDSFFKGSNEDLSYIKQLNRLMSYLTESEQWFVYKQMSSLIKYMLDMKGM